MKRLRTVLSVSLLGGIVLVSNGFAQTATPDSDLLFQQYRAAESRFSFAIAQSVGGNGTTEDANCVMPFGDCLPLNEMFRLQETLNVRADAGDANAMFYTALLKVERAKRTVRSSSKLDATKEFESAADYYKRAGEGGAIGGYWNVAQMYANGTGVIQSKSAAVEWFYKAGTAYLSVGLREKALASLDAIQSIDKEHRLGKRLQTALTKGEPK
jgi:TPR repeat protein